MWTGDGKRHTWQDIDRELRAFAKRRGRIDSDEARLLCSASRLEIWRELGKASLLDYLEEVLGYGPRAAGERVRVALALDELPELAEALASGELSYSAIRELTRIAKPSSQREWRDYARGKNLRQIEDKVAQHKKGDRPTDRPSPDLRPRVLRLEVRPATFALWRQVQQVLADERGGMLDDDALVAAIANAYLAGGSDRDIKRAKFQTLTVACPSCEYTAQEGAGVRVPIGAADRERAECDAQRIAVDGTRTTQDVTPKKRQAIHRRDGGKCCVPGCRSSRYLEIHHIVPQADGGSHELDNLTLLCDGHHHALHDGKLTITGKAPEVVVRWAHHATSPETHVGNSDSNPHVGDGPATRYERVKLATEAKQALVTLKFPKQIARDSVTAALERLGPSATLEQVIREALRSLHAPSKI
jgi:hypothetical protein